MGLQFVELRVDELELFFLGVNSVIFLFLVESEVSWFPFTVSLEYFLLSPLPRWSQISCTFFSVVFIAYSSFLMGVIRVG